MIVELCKTCSFWGSHSSLGTHSSLLHNQPSLAPVSTTPGCSLKPGTSAERTYEQDERCIGRAVWGSSCHPWLHQYRAFRTAKLFLISWMLSAASFPRLLFTHCSLKSRSGFPSKQGARWGN